MKSFLQYLYSKIPLVIFLFIPILYLSYINSSLETNKNLEKQLQKLTGLIIFENSISFVHGYEQKTLKEATNYQDIVFLAHLPNNKNRDLYISKIKKAPNNKIITLKKPINLTNSNAADAFEYKIHEQQIIVASKAMNKVNSLTIFDLSRNSPETTTSFTGPQKFLNKISNYHQTGRFFGIEKTNIRFLHPCTEVSFNIEKKDISSLVIKWQKNNTPKTTKIPFPFVKSDENFEIRRETRLPKQLILWIVDTVRSISWIGPGPIEWAEGRVFALKDKFKQISYKVKKENSKARTEKIENNDPEYIKIHLPKDDQVGDYETLQWPPDSLAPPVFPRKSKREGAWTPAHGDFIKRLPDAPPSVYQTYVHTDKDRPYVFVRLFAIDTRQLELHMVGGHEDPQSTTGEVGSGKIPSEPQILERTALAFNGAFKSIHGEYGMMENKTVLLPPKEKGATVASFEDGTIALGSWPESIVIPHDMLSYRQNMDPLVENGVINPKRRYLWGFTLDEDITMMHTVRSGICLRDDGILIYAWGEDLTANTLGIGMNAAKCNYGIHLDMNPLHTVLVAFDLTPIENEPPVIEHKMLIKELQYRPERFIHGAPKDFFYMTVRNFSPPKDGWSSKDISQPAPAFLPSVFKREINSVKMAAFDTRSVQSELAENNKNALPEKLTHNLVGEILLNSPSKTRGQIQEGKTIAYIKDEDATLCLVHGRIKIVSGKKADPNVLSAITGKWLIKEKQKQEGEGKILALGILKNWVIAAIGSFSQVAKELELLEIENALYIEKNSDQTQILLRTTKGMQDLTGKSIDSITTSTVTLRFYAKKRNSFATRLELLLEK